MVNQRTGKTHNGRRRRGIIQASRAQQQSSQILCVRVRRDPTKAQQPLAGAPPVTLHQRLMEVIAVVGHGLLLPGSRRQQRDRGSQHGQYLSRTASTMPGFHLRLLTLSHMRDVTCRRTRAKSHARCLRPPHCDTHPDAPHQARAALARHGSQRPHQITCVAIGGGASAIRVR